MLGHQQIGRTTCAKVKNRIPRTAQTPVHTHSTAHKNKREPAVFPAVAGLEERRPAGAGRLSGGPVMPGGDRGTASPGEGGWAEVSREGHQTLCSTAGRAGADICRCATTVSVATRWSSFLSIINSCRSRTERRQSDRAT